MNSPKFTSDCSRDLPPTRFASVIPTSSRDGTTIDSRLTTPIPAGESRADFANRVERGLERMLALWTPRGDAGSVTHALLIAHRGVIRAIVRKSDESGAGRRAGIDSGYPLRRRLVLLEMLDLFPIIWAAPEAHARRSTPVQR